MNTNQTTTAFLQTKQHFDILDGLRGVAALSVVIFHFMEWAYVDYSKNFIAHGFLAVDFFFCLSGFVIELKNRCKAGTSVPAQGLYLVDIQYPDDTFL
jgi:peptidoglycan/LPS O-acetylase OafA/YrhL